MTFLCQTVRSELNEFKHWRFMLLLLWHGLLFVMSYLIGDSLEGTDQQYRNVKLTDGTFVVCDTVFTTVSNLGFFLTATILAYYIRIPQHWRLYHSHILLYLTILNVGISSTLYHASDDYGVTGKMDVAAIVTVIVSVLWFILWSVRITYCQIHEDFTVLTTFKTVILFGLVGCINLVMYFLTWYDPFQLTWATKYQVFFTLIGSLVVCGAILFLFGMWKNGISASFIRLTSVVLIFIPTIIVGVVFYNYPDRYACYLHGFYSHLGLSTLINILVVFMNATFKLQVQNRNRDYESGTQFEAGKRFRPQFSGRGALEKTENFDDEKKENHDDDYRLITQKSLFYFQNKL